MSPREYELEILSRHPVVNGSPRPDRPPLLFVHGGYCDAWCWDCYFLPFLARRGYGAHALSLRGHGGSDGRHALSTTGIDDYTVDVIRVARQFDRPPVLVPSVIPSFV